MKTELYYFDGCPSYTHALHNLKHALRLQGLPERVDLIPVADVADAQAKRFLGSPTIRLDGVDLDGPDADRQGYGFGCRVYTVEGKNSAWPSVEQIRQAVERRQQTGQA